MTRRLIRSQLNLLLLAVAMPLAALLAYTIYEDLEHDEKQAGESVEMLARTLADDLAAVMGDARDLLDRLERLGAGQLLDRERCDRVFDDLLQLKPRFYAVITSNAMGAVVCEAYEAGEGQRVRPFVQRPEWITGMATGGAGVGVVESGNIRHAVRTRTLGDASGSTVGIVSVLIDVAGYAQFVDLTRYPEGTRVEVRDARGGLLFRAPNAAVPGATKEDPAIAAIMMDGRGSGIVTGDDGTERLYALAPIRGTDWHAVAGMPTEAIFAPTRELAVRNSLLAFVIIGSVGAFAWVVAGRISGPIRRMALAAQAVAGGDLNARVEVSGPAEIAEVAEQFNAMVQARLRADDLLHEAHDRLMTLSRRLLDIQESERKRIARELHDEIGQALTALSLRLQAQRARNNEATGARGLDECIAIADGTLRQVRTLCLDLHPPQLDDLGLASALRWQSDRQCQAAGIASHLDLVGLDEEPPADIATVCFRVAQEALTNVVRHSGARNVWVDLHADAGRLQLSVRDDGCGFDVAGRRRDSQRGGSIGLLSMEERVTLAGGEFEIHSRPGRGTVVKMSLPLAAAEEGE